MSVPNKPGQREYLAPHPSSCVLGDALKAVRRSEWRHASIGHGIISYRKAYLCNVPNDFVANEWTDGTRVVEFKDSNTCRQAKVQFVITLFFNKKQVT